jgi:outer membrane protein TolC
MNLVSHSRSYRHPGLACLAAGAPLLALLGLLSSCAIYAPLPLPQGDDLAASANAAHAVLTPLDMTAVASVAVLNNPGLRSARAALHVAQAQAFAAGLLPDPQLSYSADYAMDHVTSPADPRYPEYNAYGLGLTIDLQTLLTHASAHAAASANYQQARLDLLWQEWQTVAQARSLYVQQAIAAGRVAFLAPAEQTYAAAAARSQRALAAGNVTLEQSSADLAVLQDVRTQLGSADRSRLQAEQALRALLGVKPDVSIPIQALAAPPIPTRARVAAAVAQVARHRPDLLALRAGYRAQEEHVRTAVLAQFPDISLGVTRARDVSDVHTTGFGATLTLPLFDRGRGQIAIQRATRAQLHAEFQARVDQAQGDVWQLWDEMQQLDRQLHALEQQLPQLQRSVERARLAYQAGNFPAASYLTLTSAYLTATSTRFDLFQNLWTDSIGLATVLGTQIQPDATIQETKAATPKTSP